MSHYSHIPRDGVIQDLNRWWDTNPSQNTWVSVLSAHVGSHIVDQWVRSQLWDLSVASQGLFRQWRSLHCWADRGLAKTATQERAAMLVAFPLLPLHWQQPDVGDLRQEIEGAVNYYFREAGLRLTLMSKPLCVERVHRMSPDVLIEMLCKGVDDEALLEDPLKENSLSERERGTVMQLWVGRLEGSATAQSEFAELLQPSATYAAAMRALAMRAQAIQEAHGAEPLKLFPMQPLWNSGSFARLLHARWLLSALQDRYGELTCTEERDGPTSWRIHSKAQRELATLYFVEETQSDLLPLTRWVSFE